MGLAHPILVFTTETGEPILFDEWVDETGWEPPRYGYTYWTAICKDCYNKYHGVLGDRISSGGSGWCGVSGCNQAENAEYYVDFSKDDAHVEWAQPFLNRRSL